MKKILFILFLATSNFIVAQNIVFEQVAIKVKPGSGGQVLSLFNDFYGSIENQKVCILDYHILILNPKT